MTRKKFNSDLAYASQQAVTHISSVAKGDDDGQIVLTFSHDNLSSPLVIRLIALSIDSYPSCSGFLAYTDDEAIPHAVSGLFDDLPNLSQRKTVLETLDLLSKKLSAALTSESDNGSDVEMTDVDDLDEQSIDTEDEYDYGFNDDVDFGLGTTTPATLQQLPTATKEEVKITSRFIDDIRKAKEVGFKIALLSDVSKHQTDCIFALSLPVHHLGLPDDTLEAWDVESSSYVVLLCRYTSGYPCVENFTNLPPGHPSTMQFLFGKCANYKPTLSSAVTAFNPKFNHIKGEPVEGSLRYETEEQGAPFVQMPITNSINTFMNTELALLLKYRLKHGVSWDRAKELLQEHAKAGHLRQDDGILAHDTSDTAEEEEQVSATARPLLNRDYVQDGYATANSPPQTQQLSMPLIAMQFALRYFVKSTKYCVVCHRKAEPGFTAIKPYVCTEPLCLFQYMALGLGPSIEHEIIARPYVVDLLVSFCAAGLHSDRIREWPQGLAIKVPLLMTHSLQKLLEYTSGDTNSFGDQVATPPTEMVVHEPRSVWTSISAGEFNLDSTQNYPLKAGDIIILTKKPSVTDRSNYYEVHHCRIRNVDIARGADGNVAGRIVEFDCLVSAPRYPNISKESRCYGPESLSVPANEDQSSESTENNEGNMELYLYEHDLDDLPPVCQREALLTLVQAVPPIRTLREYLLSHKGSSLDKCDKIPKSALALLRWIVASNRSYIVQLEQSDEVDNGSGVNNRSREHEKIDGLDNTWMQFRFAQGSPEKEHRFKQALDQQTSSSHPTIFAWHGSPLGNWHSIIRSGLDFKDTLHGRAHGHGVYFSNQFGTSQHYSGHGSNPTVWVGSELNVTIALSLCEIVNKTSQFRCISPCYVVDKVDWIQCRYLVIQRKLSPTPQVPTTEQDDSETRYIAQDPKWVVCGLKSQPVRIPAAALPKWRQNATTSSLPLSQQTNADDEASNALDDESDDFDTIVNIQENNSQNDQIEDEEEENNTIILGSDPEKLSFTQGTLDVASLPQLPPPMWATDNGRKLLGRELSKLQKLQSMTPLHELGWYIDFEKITNMFQWIVELHSFELSLPLAQDMKRNGVNSVVLEIRFGQQFPLSPPFVRVIRPRFLPFSQRGGGHVTGGGALCMELLTNSGWSPVSSMESVLLQVRMAMCNLEPFPARLMGSSGGSSTSDYGISEAIDAYKRAAAAHGWQVPSDLDATARGL
ncbi:ubiquitin conjugating [Colletotrichum truncatum]|uniref:Ubiquitin conjugating n=1 Tax=Colletotrichum truncatum TaxID=5467 RepID=A0ACC3ZAN1_COLTU|nr:ubiquitin conjugating [Colletotrichum truncatum]KAF6796172.1 ubiquitin conjugating [Colletotrichum truncatum]